MISIINEQKKIKLDINLLKKTAIAALASVKRKPGMLCVYITDNRGIQVLNYKYRHIDKPTDVLAFSMTEGQELKGEKGILGDVVISAEAALNMAKRLKRSVKEELNFYLVHGILHLIGYDDLNERNKKKMFDVQRQILEKCDLSS